MSDRILLGTEIFEQGWPGNDTVCGWGSTMEHTTTIRAMLPRLIERYNIKSIADVGCGDLFWMQHVDLKGAKYIGYDIYERSTWPELKEKGWDLRLADIVSDPLPKIDLTIVRDVFIHLPNWAVLKALENIKANSKYLFATTFIRDELGEAAIDNFDRANKPQMKHSKIDLEGKPFELGQAKLYIPEDYPYKSMAFWRMNNDVD